jgi:hypothetical protein
MSICNAFNFIGLQLIYKILTDLWEDDILLKM